MPIANDTAPGTLTLDARNQELLTHRDGALLFIYRFMSNREDAEDVLQEAYLKAVRSHTPLLSGTELRKWFFQIAANTAVSALRTNERRRTRERSAAAMSISAIPERSGPDAEDLKRAVEAELAALDEKYRTAISLHYEQGFTYEEASEILGVPAGTLRAHSSQGLKLLRERLDTPQRRISAEKLLALLAAGVVFHASPTSAAAVTQIVAAGQAAPASSNASLGIAAKAAIVLVSVAGCGALMILLYVRIATSTHSSTPATPQRPIIVADIQKTDAAPAKVAAKAAPVPPRKADYVPPPDVEALWANAVDLLEDTDPERHPVMGAWMWSGADLLMKPGRFSRLAIPRAAPEEYDLRADFTRHSGYLDVVMIFGVNGGCGTWLMGAQDGTSYCFGHHQNNNRVVRAPALANGVRHTCIIQVRKQTLTALLDGVMVLSISLGESRYEPSADLRLPNPSWFGVGGWQTEVQFHRLAVREVSGKVGLADLQTHEAPDMPEHWADARNLMPAETDAAHALGGTWRLQNGTLSVDAPQVRARHQLDCQPPEEYDMRVDFTRTQGNRGLIQILAVGGRQFVARVDEDGISGLDKLGDKYFYDCPTVMHTQQLKNGAVHCSIICVRKTGIRAYIDGKLWLNSPVDYPSMNLDPAWMLKSPVAVGVGTHESSMTIHTILLKDISGTGKVLPPPPSPAQDAVPPPRPAERAGF